MQDIHQSLRGKVGIQCKMHKVGVHDQGKTALALFDGSAFKTYHGFSFADLCWLPYSSYASNFSIEALALQRAGVPFVRIRLASVNILSVRIGFNFLAVVSD